MRGLFRENKADDYLLTFPPGKFAKMYHEITITTKEKGLFAELEKKSS